MERNIIPVPGMNLKLPRKKGKTSKILDRKW